MVLAAGAIGIAAWTEITVGASPTTTWTPSTERRVAGGRYSRGSRGSGG